MKNKGDVFSRHHFVKALPFRPHLIQGSSGEDPRLRNILDPVDIRIFWKLREERTVEILIDIQVIRPKLVMVLGLSLADMKPPHDILVLSEANVLADPCRLFDINVALLDDAIEL